MINVSEDALYDFLIQAPDKFMIEVKTNLASIKK